MKCKIKIKSDFVRGYKTGDVVSIEVDKNNVPMNQFWRNCLRDSVFDDCIELIKGSKSKTKKNEGAKENE